MLARKLQSLGRAEEGLVATSERTERATGRVEQSFRRIEVASIRQPGPSSSLSARKGIPGGTRTGVTTQARANELIGAS
jgi:hypothetical protein